MLSLMKALLSLSAPLLLASTAVAHPADQWEFVVESGYLWNVGDNTSIDYEIIPTQLTFRSPTMWTWFSGDDGSRLVVRNRFAAIFETITVGPEDYYIGLSAAPSIEYWFPSETTSIFFSIGGGVGLTNSTDVFDGQGQDFTFNWFSQLGVRQQITKDLSLLGGAYFVHHSNGGQTDPNPGIDALGFTIGLGMKF
jgi:lipid A 3-O-deacylase